MSKTQSFLGVALVFCMAGAVEAQVPPNISEVATCNVPPAGSLPWHMNPPSSTPSRNLFRIVVDNDVYPEAVCNDGSPAVFYVRPGVGAHTDDWVIHLQGGGGCRGHQECMQRYCSQGVIYDATKMSSDWAPELFEGKGLFARRNDGTNPLADYNQVYIYYCSSDSWKGTVFDAVYDGTPAYSLHYQGHNIIAAVVENLRLGAVARYQGNLIPMPLLDDARQVLFTGTSAGGGGVRNNVDWLAFQLESTNPDLDFRAVVDAGYSPLDEEYLPAADYQAVMKARWVIDENVLQGFTDQSCEAMHSPPQADEDERWRCMDNRHILRHHITTPFFVRMDLKDATALPWVNPITGVALGTSDDFAVAVAAQLRKLAWQTLPDGGAEEWYRMTLAPGAFGPMCGQHVGLKENGAFHNTFLPGPAGPLSCEDVLWNWVEGQQPQIVVDDPLASVTNCP